MIRTGNRCSYGKPVQIVHDAGTKNHFEDIVLQIVRSLLMVDILLALHAGMSPASLIPFVLILLISAIPVALPPAFTLANALSAARLSQKGVLVTRLSSISDIAAMKDLLCAKTGTLTENRLTVRKVLPQQGVSEQELLDGRLRQGRSGSAGHGYF